MASSVLSIGITGLSAAQAGLATASHNIANAATEGYSRQSIRQATNIPVFSGSGYFGNGVNVETIERSYNNFVAQQVLSADTRYQQTNTNYELTKQVDDLLGDPAAGLSVAVQDFFRGVQGVASDSASVPARQSMLAQSQSLVSRLHTLSARLNELRDQVGGEITGSVTNINGLAKEVAELNLRIIEASGQGQPPNDLYDQRDVLIAQLNAEIQVTTTTNSDGSFNVFIGNGQPLVVRTEASALSAGPANDDISRVAISIALPSGSSLQLPESAFTGGKLSGMLDYRREGLDTVQNSLGRIALAMTETFNAQHRLGQDLNGNLGGDYFVPLAGQTVYPNRPPNTGSATLSVPIDNVGALTTSDYRLSYTAANTFQLVRQSDGQVWTAAGASPAAALSAVLAAAPAQGFSLNLAGTPNVGDSFLVQPTRTAAQNFNVAISDTRLIAAGTPIRTQTPASNTGTASIDQGRVLSVANLTPPPALSLPVSLSFSAGNLSGFPAGFPITVTQSNGSSTSYPAASSVPYSSGATISFAGIEVKLSGQPATGDSFAIQANPASAVSDNRNAVALGALQQAKTMISGGASYEAAYAQLVSQVGADTRELQVTAQSQKVVLDRVTDAAQSVSGVNLDEEASNLIRFQQAYQASARVMDVAGKLFDEILAVAR